MSSTDSHRVHLDLVFGHLACNPASANQLDSKSAGTQVGSTTAASYQCHRWKVFITGAGDTIMRSLLARGGARGVVLGEECEGSEMNHGEVATSPTHQPRSCCRPPAGGGDVVRGGRDYRNKAPGLGLTTAAATGSSRKPSDASLAGSIWTG